MFSFLAFLFLGTAMTGKIMYDDAKRQTYRSEYEMKAAAIRQRFDVFVAKHKDLALEQRIKAHPEMLDGLADKIYEVSGITRPTEIMLRMLAMAEYGKIPHECLEYWMTGPITGELESRKRKYEELRKFMVYYNRILRSHGVEEDILQYRYGSMYSPLKEVTKPLTSTSNACRDYSWKSLGDDHMHLTFGNCNVVYY